jgi:hypothetical protein
MIPFLAPFLAPALGSAATAAGMGTIGSLLSSKILGPALLSGIGSLISGEDLGGALKSAAMGGVGGALNLGGAGAGAVGEVAKEGVKGAVTDEAVRQSLGEIIQNEGLGAGIASLTGEKGLLSPSNMLLYSMFMPKAPAPEREPYMGGGYYGPGGRYVPASRVLNRAEGGRIVGPGTPTSDSIPATIYQDGMPVGEAALSTQEVVLSHKDLAAMDPDGNYERASELIGNAKNGDRAKMAAELYLKMRKA